MLNNGTAGLLLAALGIAAFTFRAPIVSAWAWPEERPLLAGATLAAVGLGLCFDFIATRPGPNRRPLAWWRVGRTGLYLTAVVLTLIAISVYFHPPEAGGRFIFADLIFAAAFAGAIGFAELIQRYRDDPANLMGSVPATIYVCVNMAASVAAFNLVVAFDVFEKTTSHREIYEVMTAGFGSIAFFRSSLFTARVGGKDVDVGPSTLLRSLLEASDREIDRSQAGERMSGLPSIMDGVDFAKAKNALPMLCFTAAENVPREHQTQAGTAIREIDGTPDLSGAQRSVLLGAALIAVVGPEVLDKAVKALGDGIRLDPPASV